MGFQYKSRFENGTETDPDKKQCSKCKRELRLDYFYMPKKDSGWTMRICKDCISGNIKKIDSPSKKATVKELSYETDFDGGLNSFVLKNLIFSMTKEIVKDNPKKETANNARFALLAYFGLIDGEEWTLKRIAEKTGKTQENSRQKIAWVLRKLREPKYAKILKEFISI